MPTVEQLREKLVSKLKELFQLDEPDLDFGFYRIMHAKAQEVQNFLEKDLLAMVHKEFQDADDNRIQSLYEAWQKTLEDARAYGVENPEQSTPVLQAKAKLDAARDTASAEGEVYDHLRRFFERYYEDGDFISLRYYSRENSSKAAPYAIPYNGEEVKLHWANADQYYIKTTDNFSDFSVLIGRSEDNDILPVARQKHLSLFEAIPATKEDKLRLHFKVRTATEGEHGNIKEEHDKERFFKVHADEPVAFTEDGELVIYFSFAPDPMKQGTAGKWQATLNEQSERITLMELDKLVSAKGASSAQADIAARYLARLQAQSDPKANPGRTILARYITRYTARNTKDYFIHKDLGAFLRRELDFYLKNEVMRLDDIESADAPAVESYLKKLRVMRRIAGKLIAFLAQLEDFQKKLWLKKKFVVECNYCMTLDRVPEEMYPTIISNDAQWQEWQKLYALEDHKRDALFLRNHPYMMIDTHFFDASFTNSLLANFDEFDSSLDGILINSENYQALNFIQEKYREQIQCIYIDPPYNTDASPIMYKNGYKNSSWVSLLSDRLSVSTDMLDSDGILAAAIDDEEYKELGFLIKDIYPTGILGSFCVRSNPSGRPTQTGYSVAHEYILYAGKSKSSSIGRLPPTEQQSARFTECDELGAFEWRNLRREGSNSDRNARPMLYYPIYIGNGNIRVPKMEWDESIRQWDILEHPTKSEVTVLPINDTGEEKTWRWGHVKVQKNIISLAVRKDRSGKDYVYYKRRPHEDGVVSVSTWFDAKHSATEHGSNVLKELGINFLFPKSIHAVQDSIYIGKSVQEKSVTLDYFGGSGTTAHAVINLNREDNGNRKYILVEMGHHFNGALKPRIQKVVYSNAWKAGQPLDTKGISHCFKYLRLESYEDTLNNLTLARTPEQERALNASDKLREDYMLRYFLDVESKGSQSLLNIEAFRDPRAYKLLVKRTASNEYAQANVDIIETFNWLIGLRVDHIDVPQLLTAEFIREPDPEVPEHQETRLVLKNGLKQVKEDGNNVWWFRKIEGRIPEDRFAPNNSAEERVLIVWRTLSGDLEKDNAVLEAWFEKNRISTKEQEFDVIYVNGSNTLPNLRRNDEHWKVVLIEEEFLKRMWDVE